MEGARDGQHFGSAKESAKLVRAIVNALRRTRLDYKEFRPASTQLGRVPITEPWPVLTIRLPVEIACGSRLSQADAGHPWVQNLCG